MNDKTPLGIPLFDERYGGICRNRSTLCIGRRGSGKTVASLQALLQCRKDGVRGLLLSTRSPSDLTAFASELGLPLAAAVDQREVLLLEYADVMTTRQFENGLALPPDDFTEFMRIVQSNDVQRVIIDTVLPWVAIPTEARLVKHIFSFVHALERMDVTSVFTLPMPASAMAFTLRNSLTEQSPVVFTLELAADGQRNFAVSKHPDNLSRSTPMPFQIAPGIGIHSAPDSVSHGHIAP